MKNRYLITKILSIMLVCMVLVGHCTGCAKTEVMEAEVEETEEVSSQISITKIAEYDSGVINPDGEVLKLYSIMRIHICIML